MANDTGFDSYATISFSNTNGIPVNRHEINEYYVLGPQNNDLKSDTFIGMDNYPEGIGGLPSTGTTLDVDGLFLSIFNIIIVSSLFCVLCRLKSEID